jgi:hypothetical protein
MALTVEGIIEILELARTAYDKASQYHIDTLSTVFEHKEVQFHAGEVLKASAKEQAVSILLQQIEAQR